MLKLTAKELQEAIDKQQQARDQAWAQANFNAGYLQCLNDLRDKTEDIPDQVPANDPEAPTAPSDETTPPSV